MSTNYEKAKELAAMPYSVVMYRDAATDGDGFVYLASNPEIERCKAQGLTMEEAQENLDEVRVMLFEHYLDHNLPIPQPNWEPDSAQDDFLDFLEQDEEKSLEKDIEQVIQTDHRERLYSALLKT